MHITCLNASLGSPDITHAIEILTSPWAYTGILHNVSKPQALLFINALFINGFLVWLLATFVNDFYYLFLLLVFSIWCLYYWMYNTRNTVLCSQSVFCLLFFSFLELWCKPPVTEKSRSFLNFENFSRGVVYPDKFFPATPARLNL